MLIRPEFDIDFANVNNGNDDYWDDYLIKVLTYGHIIDIRCYTKEDLLN